jgi:hypothetical protein
MSRMLREFASPVIDGRWTYAVVAPPHRYHVPTGASRITPYHSRKLGTFPTEHTPHSDPVNDF